jgi:hypothetical protein
LTGGGSFGDDVAGTRSGNFALLNVFHVYQFNGSPGERITLAAVLPDDSDLKLGIAILSPTGQETAFIDFNDQTDNTLSLENFTLAQTGTYTVIVYTLNGASGSYDLTFQREP